MEKEAEHTGFKNYMFEQTWRGNTWRHLQTDKMADHWQIDVIIRVFLGLWACSAPILVVTIEMILVEILVVESLKMIMVFILVLKRQYYLIYNYWFCLILSREHLYFVMDNFLFIFLFFPLRLKACLVIEDFQQCAVSLLHNLKGLMLSMCKEGSQIYQDLGVVRVILFCIRYCSCYTLYVFTTSCAQHL